MKKAIQGLFVSIFTMLVLTSSAQKQPDFLTNHNTYWVDSVFNAMTLDQKVGQLLMPRGNFSGQGYEPEKIVEWVKKYHIGGVAFFAGQPTTQALIVNLLQEVSKTPLFIGADYEWGLAMRLDSTVRFPYQLALGAMSNNEALIEKMGAEIGRQCRRIGVHINYAPVVDVNVDPNNPVINFRSFGEDKNAVANKGLAYMKGLQSQYIIATAKHFPGHGDTGVDSHYDLPIIKHDRQRLEEVELYPFKKLINNGLSGIMTAHLSIPALDDTPNLSSTMSPKIVNDLLRKDLGYAGLLFTDAMDMQGAVKYFPEGKALVMAALAGNDILETFTDVPTAFTAIKKAVELGEFPMEVLNARVKKILKAKSWVGLDEYQPTRIENLIEDLHSSESEFLNREFAEGGITLIKNANNLLPIKDLTQRIAVVSVDTASETAFQRMADNYTTVSHFNIPAAVDAAKADEAIINAIITQLSSFDVVLVGLHLSNIRPYSNYGITESTQFALSKLVKFDNVAVTIFGNAYALGKLENLTEAKSIVMANQLTDYTEEAAAQAIFGAIPMRGKLPVTVNDTYKFGDGISSKAIGRLAYGVPEQVGVNSELLNARIDSVINAGLKAEAYPGAVMQVAKDGRVIYQKTFGYHTYEDAKNGDMKLRKTAYDAENRNDAMDMSTSGTVKFANKKTGYIDNERGVVQLGDIYDFASVTKISTSALAVMQLMSEGKFDLDKTFGDYYPTFKNTNKVNLKFRDMLTHRSGLKAWIPFWMDAVDSVATIKKAVERRMILESDLVKTEEGRNFFERLFGKDITYTTDYKGSIAKVWKKAVSPKTITWKPGVFSDVASDDFTVQIADTLWLHKNYDTTIFQQIADSPVKPDQGYVYSDLHYYTYPRFVPLLTGVPWEDYLKKTYHALGANSLTYNPLLVHDRSKIVPTEQDNLFRKTLIYGRVHDEGAGMLNGISGHAGLFGNANDLMKLMQMYSQNGSYGGRQFIKPEVIKEVTRYQFDPKENRRAIAFDKLHPDNSIANGPQGASPESYGHSGYTGTFTWVDPATNSVYVFLSNRVYPTRDNNKISSMNIRTEVGNQLYRTIKEGVR
jgi:beta-glucosidase-like glycosyl hydrolase/CubicO group peptidase (beta-lactamase class C family)